MLKFQIKRKSHKMLRTTQVIFVWFQLICEKWTDRTGLKPIGSHAGVIYSRLFKNTQQYIAGFTENNIGPRTS